MLKISRLKVSGPHEPIRMRHSRPVCGLPVRRFSAGQGRRCCCSCFRRKNGRLFFRIIEDKEEMAFFRDEMSRMLKLLIRTGVMKLIYPNYKRYLQEIMNGKDVIFRNAPHMIVAATPKNAPCKEADPWISLSYFDLFAQTFGLGTCWCGFGVYALRWNARMRKKLNLPRGYRISSVLLFGKPSVIYPRATLPPPFKINDPA